MRQRIVIDPWRWRTRPRRTRSDHGSEIVTAPRRASTPQLHTWIFDLDRIADEFIDAGEDCHWERVAGGFVDDGLALGLRLI